MANDVNKESIVNRKTAQIYGTFLLDRTEFTLPVENIQEVVNVPALITPVPLAPEYLLGIFNLRGQIVPIISMRKLLKYPMVDMPAAKVAIIDFEDSKVGLLFDSAGEILHAHHDDRNDFQFQNRSGHHALRGALKLDNGNRIVQILDPSGLLKVENLPQILQNIDKKNPRVDQAAKGRGARRQEISFRAGKTRLALEIGAIFEIVHVPELQAPLIASENSVGIANVRGDLIPVLDFVKMLGYRDDGAAKTGDERILVLKGAAGKVGLLIDSVDNIASFYPDELLPIPTLHQKFMEIFGGLITRGESGDVILLKPEAVLAVPEIHDLADGHTALFSSNSEAAKARKTSGQRHVCIAFQLERRFALPIERILEIVNYSPDTLQPPATSKLVRGLLNLRGQVVTLIDLRALFGLAPYSDIEATKVLIVENGAHRFGLLVDSVDTIVSYFDEQKIRLPSYLTGADRTLQTQVTEILEVNTQETVMMLELERILGSIEASMTPTAA